MSDAATLIVAPAAPGRRRSARFRARPPRSLVVAAGAIAALFAVPLAYLVVHDAALGSRAVDIARGEGVGGPLRRTLALATTVSVGATVLGTGVAWLLTRTDVPGRRWWRLVVPLPLVIPSFVGAFALVAAFAPGGLVDTYLGVDRLPEIRGFGAAVTVLVLLTYPYVYLPVAARLASLPPSLEESARALGRRPVAVFATVVLPQCAGALWAGGLLVFLYSLSEFGAVQLLHYDTLTRAIYAARLFDRDVALVLSLVLAIVALAVVTAERVVTRRRVHAEAVAPASAALQVRLGPWRGPSLAGLALLVGAALVVPLFVLGHWVVRGVAGDARFEPGELFDPAFTTAWLGVATAVFAVAVLLPVAFLTVRHRSAAGEAANAVVVSGFALPGLVLALAVVFFVVQSPVSGLLYQTYGLLLFAYAVHFGSQALRASQVAVSGVPRRLEDAARSLGAGRVRRLLTVQLPLMRGGLAAGAGLVLLSTMKELPATLVLAPPGTRTLATHVWETTSEGLFAQAGLAALVLVALSAVLTFLLTIRPSAR